MWDCPRCGRAFAHRNQAHACAPLGDLDRHFARASPAVRAAFDRVLAAVSGLGPVTVKRLLTVRRGQRLGSLGDIGDIGVRLRKAQAYVTF